MPLQSVWAPLLRPDGPNDPPKVHQRLLSYRCTVDYRISVVRLSFRGAFKFFSIKEHMEIVVFAKYLFTNIIFSFFKGK